MMKNPKHKLEIPILMYHNILANHEAGGTPSSIYEHQFEEQMNYLAENNFETITLPDVLELTNNKNKNTKKPVVITFDDGYENNFTYAFPILKKHNLKATIFIIVNRVASANYMSWQQLEEMSNFGIDMQSHTFSHKPLETLSTTAITHELQASKKILGERLKKPVDFISFPHGSCNKNIIENTKKLGYQGSCTSQPGIFNSHDSPYNIKRIDVRRSYDIQDFEKIVNKNQLFINKIILITSVKRLIQKLIGINNWNRLYKNFWRISETN